jgi:hypothetical protein
MRIFSVGGEDAPFFICIDALKIWYVELVDKTTGAKLPLKSTRQTIRDEAAIIVNGWLFHGLPAQGVNPPKKKSEALDLAAILTIIMKSGVSIPRTFPKSERR